MPVLSARGVFVLLAIVSLFVGCKSGNNSAPEPDAPAAEPAATGGDAAAPEASADGMADVPTKIDVSAVKEEGRVAMFVPAPTEFQAALQASDIKIDIRKLVKDSGRTLEGKNRSIIALETGVRLSNLLLSVQAQDKTEVINRVKLARDGVEALGLPQEVLAGIDSTMKEYQDGSLSDAELGPVLDILAKGIRDDLADQADPPLATLVEAGGWDQGVYLLSTALGEQGVTGDAADLLHQPTVLAHFTKFIKESDAGRAGDPDVVSVIGELDKMQVIASKAELTSDDVKAVAAHTAAILAWF